MIQKPLEQISASDLRSLLGTAREGKSLEFKKMMPAKNNEEIIKFLRAVSSLANTTGGDLVIGIEARKGLAHAIQGSHGDMLDDYKLRLSQHLTSHLEPRLPRCDMHGVDCGDEGHVLVIRVPRSWLAPHRIKIDNTFYARNSAGNYPLDVSDLRAAFTLSDTVAERIRKFRVDRLIKISAGETPLSMRTMPALVVHVVPLSSFAEGRPLDIVSAIANGHVMPLPPGRQFHPNNYATNLDGLVTFTNPNNEPAHAYAQVFRTGAIEGVDTLSIDENGVPYLLGASFENTIVSTLRNYLLFLKDIGIALPAFIFVSLCGVRGCHLRHRGDGAGGYYNAGPLRDETIVLPEAMIEGDPADIPATMRLTFNTIWNAFGFASSDKYNAHGQWIGTG